MRISCYTGTHRVVAQKIIVDNKFFHELPGKMLTVFNGGYIVLSASSPCLCRASIVHVPAFSGRLSALTGQLFHPGVLGYGNMHTELFLIFRLCYSVISVCLQHLLYRQILLGEGKNN